ncbi:MAG: hypothetical protein ABR599_04540 [Gemmatimonadota bacterium]
MPGPDEGPNSPPAGRAFAVLPLRPPFLQVYHEAVAPAAAHAGYVVRHAGDTFGIAARAADLRQGIGRARFVIADVSEDRPEVAYQLGLAHGLRRPTILIARDGTRVPDVEHVRFIGYGSGPGWRRELRRRLVATIAFIEHRMQRAPAPARALPSAAVPVPRQAMS